MSKQTLTPDAVRRDVADLLAFLQDADLAYTVNPVRHVDRGDYHLITWEGRVSGHPLFIHDHDATVTDYLQWVEDGAYSAMLTDGALLQITYAIAKGDVSSHRLAYIPSPFDVDEDMLDTGDLVGYLTEMPFSTKDVYLRTPIRFDFDLGAASDAHPASHLTMNNTDCRVPCRTWMPLSRFIRFVFQQHYPEQWAVHDRLRSLTTSRSTSSDARLGAAFIDQVHVSWA